LPNLAAKNIVQEPGRGFRADVSFVTLTPQLGVPWATVASVVARDAHNVAIPAKASGEVAFVVVDPAAFAREVLSSGDALTVSRTEISALVTSQFADIFRTGGLDGADLLGPIGRLGLIAGEQLVESLRAVGLALIRFTVKTVTVSPEYRRAAGTFVEGASDGYRGIVPPPLYPDLPETPAPPSSPSPVTQIPKSGLMGLPALPAGLADILEPPLPRNNGPKSARLPLAHDAPEGIFASRQPAAGPKSERLLLEREPEEESLAASPSEHLFDPPSEQSPRSPAPVENPAVVDIPDHTSKPAVNDRPPGPPPIPATIEFHVAINGTPVGPFDLLILAARVRDGSLGRASLVWRPGMDDWCAAESVAALAPLFAGPPPLARSRIQ
jgi:hypothetical protein